MSVVNSCCLCNGVGKWPVWMEWCGNKGEALAKNRPLLCRQYVVAAVVDVCVGKYVVLVSDGCLYKCAVLSRGPRILRE